MEEWDEENERKGKAVEGREEGRRERDGRTPK